MAMLADFIRPSEVASLLDMHVTNVHRLTKRGQVESIQIHPSLRLYRKADVLKLIEHRQAGAVPAVNG
jgi:DNA-binding transcriptional MerR regulator